MVDGRFWTIWLQRDIMEVTWGMIRLRSNLLHHQDSPFGAFFDGGNYLFNEGRVVTKNDRIKRTLRPF